MIEFFMALALLGPNTINSIELSDEPAQPVTTTIVIPMASARSAMPTVVLVAVPEIRAVAPIGGPMRFDMTQNGKKMTADDFDAWMKSNGIRIVPMKKPVD